MSIKWSICIASNPHRLPELQRLMKVLLPQVDKYKGQIEILIFWNNFEYSLGYLRQSMLTDARGEYINHIDDDDMVPIDYCDTIFPLLDGVDYIGFMVDFIDRGKKMPPVYHSLKYSTWYQDDEGYYRGVTHLNPVRTELARESSFPINYNVGEDAEWSRRVKAETEHVIDKAMYIYLHQPEDSVAYTFAGKQVTDVVGVNINLTSPHDTPVRPSFPSKNVRFHPESTKDANDQA